MLFEQYCTLAITIASPFATQSLVLRHFLARPVMSLHRKKRAAFCHWNYF